VPRSRPAAGDLAAGPGWAARPAAGDDAWRRPALAASVTAVSWDDVVCL